MNKEWHLKTIERVTFTLGVIAVAATIVATVATYHIGALDPSWEVANDVGYFGAFLLPLSLLRQMLVRIQNPRRLIANALRFCWLIVALICSAVFAALSVQGWDTIGANTWVGASIGGALMLVFSGRLFYENFSK